MLNAILLTLGIGAVLGLILGIASVLFAVKEDERLEKLNTMMPGYNCGGCGFAV
ncbi:MAG: electron transporter RnfB, partial [Erysipelotrichaceae bacterium]|nr:electron transporter RnfB [Erysipelotrichaceae bacterium]